MLNVSELLESMKTTLLTKINGGEGLLDTDIRLDSRAKVKENLKKWREQLEKVDRAVNEVYTMTVMIDRHWKVLQDCEKQIKSSIPDETRAEEACNMFRHRVEQFLNGESPDSE